MPGCMKTRYVAGMVQEVDEFYFVQASPLSGLGVQTPDFQFLFCLLTLLHAWGLRLLGDDSCPACLVGLSSGSNKLAMQNMKHSTKALIILIIKKTFASLSSFPETALHESQSFVSKAELTTMADPQTWDSVVQN